VTFVLIRFAGRQGSSGSPRALVLAAAGLLVVALGVAWVLPQEARSRLSTLASTRTGGPDPFRLGVWRDSLRLAASSPFLGSGLGAFEDALPRFKTTASEHRVEHAENDYIEALAEGGGGALTLFAVAAFSGLGLGLRRQRAEPHRLARGLAAGALGGLVALLVHSAFDFNLRIPSNALLFGLLFAIALPPDARVAETGAEENAGAFRVRTLVVPSFILAVTAALGFFASWAPRRLDAARLVRRPASADALRTRALGGDATEQLRRRPADAQAWIVLAWLRAPASPPEAGELASWGVGLDPEHVALRRAAETVSGAQIQPRRP
jgi:hypothetical protein